MSDGDLKDHALNSSHDFYELLGVEPTANDLEIRRGFRKTALKHHPDKVGASQAALDRFHLLQIAYDVLLDSGVRQLYDNARRAREEKKERDAAYEGRRRQLKEDLERRESLGVAGLKRNREETQEEEAFEREVKRLAADGARRRKEREEQLRREAQEQMRDELDNANGHPSTEAESKASNGVEEIDRTIKFRYSAQSSLNEDELRSRFGKFGKIQDIVMTDKKIKPEGEKHRKDYKIVRIIYESIVGAHAAVTEVYDLTKTDQYWTSFEKLDWASGREPDCLPKWNAASAPVASRPTTGSQRTDTAPTSPPKTPVDKIKSNLKKVPSFGSFKGTPATGMRGSGGAVGSPTLEELTMIRLKNAERKRLAESLRREEAAEEAAEGVNG